MKSENLQFEYTSQEILVQAINTLFFLRSFFCFVLFLEFWLLVKDLDLGTNDIKIITTSTDYLQRDKLF